MTPNTDQISLPAPPIAARGAAPRPGSWSDLFSPQHLPAAIVLAGGVAMYAINVYVTAALLPSATQEIGGTQYYAWVATTFLAASVIASMLVTRLLAAIGAAKAYMIAFSIFTLGSVINTVVPSMEMLLVGRTVQGLGGGLLAGLGYAVIRTALPDRLWTRAAGLVSAMWGVGNLLGPALGGLFAQFGLWRGAFALLALLGAIGAGLSLRALPGQRGGEAMPPVPVWSLGLLTLAAAAFSVTAVLPKGRLTFVGLAAGALVLVAFVLVERASTHTVLPHLTYKRGNRLKWVYLTLGILSAGAMTEAFIPLFGQELAGLGPLVAGFLGAALSVGWTAAQLLSVNIEGERGKRFVIVAGPALLATGLFGTAALLSDGAGPWLASAWAAALFAAGCGIGLAFPHLSVAAMRSTTVEAEAQKAAAGVSTTQLIANAVFSAVVGILVSVGGPSVLGSAQLMAAGIGVLAVLSMGTSIVVTRGSRG